MGSGYQLTCVCCGKSHAVFTGFGMAFPRVYAELVEDIQAGRFGREWQQLVEETELFAIDAEKHLYRCESCGHWECALGLSIYEPKDPEKILHTRFGEKTMRERGRAPYATCADLRKDYTLVKERVHTCERCGSDMHEISERDLSRVVLKCPDCGGRLERGCGELLWD